MSSILLPAFILGLFGSFHCMGMCGPLVMSMPFQFVEKGKKISATILYHVGKTMSYALFGLIAGSIGKGFVFFKWQQSLSILAGLVLLLITFIPYLKQKLVLPIRLPDLFSMIYQRMQSNPSIHYFFLLGFLNGLLPCGLVYAALAGAMATGSPISGWAFMFFFGLGTMPSLSILIFFQQKFSITWRKYFLKSSTVLSIFIGILLIFRGLNLGIPYISPSFNSHTQQMSCCNKP